MLRNHLWTACVLALAVVVLTGCPTTPPSAAFTYSPTEGQAPLEISFTDTSVSGTAAITAWLWEFGDADETTSDEQNPSFIFTAPGVYTVALTVTTSAGTDTATALITVSPRTGGEACSEESLVGQAPPLPEEVFYIVWSDESVNNVMYDNFSDVGASIGGIQWWGFSTTTEGASCIPDPDTCAIRFYEDGSQPGQLVAEYTVTPSRAATGLEYQGLDLSRFSATFNTPVAMASGWLSVAGVGGSECKRRMISSVDGDMQCLAENLETSEWINVGHDLALCLIEGVPGT